MGYWEINIKNSLNPVYLYEDNLSAIMDVIKKVVILGVWGKYEL